MSANNKKTENETLKNSNSKNKANPPLTTKINQNPSNKFNSKHRKTQVFNNFACSRKNLKVTSWNCNSYRAHQTEIGSFLEKNRPDILCLQEINLNDQEANFLLDFKGYDTYYKCRHTRSGGGVALVVSKSLSYSDLDQEVEKALA